MDKSKSQRPGVMAGALVGGLLTLPLIVVFYLGSALAGLPFVPLDLFDWVARVLPGPIITFGIDTMVSIITTFNIGETSATAKTAEHLMGLGAFLSVGIVAGAIYFAVMRTQSIVLKTWPGVALGVVVGLPLMAVTSSISAFTASVDPMMGLLWGVALFIGWGMAIAWIYNDLRDLAPVGAEADGMTAETQVLNRRQFLVRVGGATATLTVIGAGLGALLSRTENTATEILESVTTDGQGNRLPNAVPGNLVSAPGTRPEYTPIDKHYRIDISSRPPEIDAEAWRLKLTGLVENPVELSLEQLRSDFPSVDHFVTLSCISNPLGGSLISTTKWTGIPFSEMIKLVKPQGNARAVRITSADGFDEYVSLDLIAEDERIMLAYAWDGAPLAVKHGFPLRIWIPDRFGMKQPKWIEEIEFVEAWEEGYWVRRGWSREAIARATSVIDTVAVENIVQQDNGDLFVPVGGISWAGARSISKVEVRVDGGQWAEAELRQPLSDTTWVIWRYDWPFVEGSHTFEVRCVDGEGEGQIESVNPNRPDGATGIYLKRATVAAPVPETSS